MSETYLRQWTMLRMIPRAPRKIDSRTLLDKLADSGFVVSKRSIERDLISLSAIFPLQSDERSKPYGWSWTGKDVFDIPSMEPNTALTFALASQFLEPLLPRSSQKHLEPYFIQAKQVLKKIEKSGLGKWPDKVRILGRGQKLLARDVPPKILDTVYEAILTGKRLMVSYKPRDEDNAREYEMNPLGLVFRDAVIYIVCSLWDYDEIKQFVMHRITKTELLDKKCRLPKNFNLDDYIASGEFHFPVNEKMIRLKVLFSPDAAIHLKETQLSDDQTSKEQKDGRILIEATVQDTLELRWWLLGFGDNAEVVKPISLRKEFKQTAENLSKYYR